MLHHRSGAISGFKDAGLVVIVTLVTGIILTGCAAPAQAPAVGPSTGSVSADQPVPVETEPENRVIEYVVVDKQSIPDNTPLEAAYILAPPSESLSQILEEFGRTDSDNIGVLTPYEIGVEQGLNGPLVIQATDSELPGTLGELTFADPFFAESEDRSFLFEFEGNEAFTATMDLDVFGSFFYTHTLPDLGSVSTYSFTVPGIWVDYCAEHPVECSGAGGDLKDICKCGYWWFDRFTFTWVWKCNPCN